MIRLEDQPIENQIKNNRPKKADIVFNKLMVQQKRSKNPFDEIKSKIYNPVDKSNPRNEMDET